MLAALGSALLGWQRAHVVASRTTSFFSYLRRCRDTFVLATTPSGTMFSVENTQVALP